MWKFLTRIFQKSIRICDQCGIVLKKNDPAICLHGIDNGLQYELYVCEPCCLKLANEYDDIEEFEFAEDRDDYPEQDAL